jgi:hypothetical protein
MQCTAIVSSQCPNGHKISRKCHDKAAAVCRKCEAVVKAQEKRQQRDHELEQERQAKQRAYLARLVEIEDEIEHQKRLLKDRAVENDQEAALAQKRKDLENFKKKVSSPTRSTNPGAPTNAESIPPATNQTSGTENTTTQRSSSNQPSPQDNTAGGGDASTWNHSDAKDDWEQQKKFDGAENEALDSLMPMIGKNEQHLRAFS